MQNNTRKLFRLFDRTLESAALIGGWVLFAIMILVTIAVVFRYVFNAPILGDVELVEMGMAVVVMMAMPYTARLDGHIRVDIFDHALGAIGRYVTDLVWRVIAIYVLQLLIQKTYAKTLDAIEYEDVTNMLELPVAIAYGSITLGMTLMVLVFFVQLVCQLLGRELDLEEDHD